MVGNFTRFALRTSCSLTPVRSSPNSFPRRFAPSFQVIFQNGFRASKTDSAVARDVVGHFTRCFRRFQASQESFNVEWKCPKALNFPIQPLYIFSETLQIIIGKSHADFLMANSRS